MNKLYKSDNIEHKHLIESTSPYKLYEGYITNKRKKIYHKQMTTFYEYLNIFCSNTRNSVVIKIYYFFVLFCYGFF